MSTTGVPKDDTSNGQPSLSRLFLENPKGSRAPATQKARGLKRSADH